MFVVNTTLLPSHRNVQCWCLKWSVVRRQLWCRSRYWHCSICIQVWWFAYSWLIFQLQITDLAKRVVVLLMRREWHWSNCIQMKWWSYSWLIFQPSAAHSTGTEGGGASSIERFLAASLLISKCCGVWCGMVWCVVWCVVMILLLTHPTAAALAQRVVVLFLLLSVFLQRCC